MKKVVLGTVIAAAALFTGCEDVKEVTSCDLKGYVLGYDVHACVESEDDAYIRAACTSEYTGFLGSSSVSSAVVSSGCSGQASKICNSVQNGVELTLYMYGSAFKNVDCKDYEDYAHK